MRRETDRACACPSAERGARHAGVGDEKESQADDHTSRRRGHRQDVTATAFGIALPGIPVAICSHLQSHAARSTMPYSSERAGEAFVGFREDDNGIDVGWRNWGSYRVDGPPSPGGHAVVTATTEVDAAVCFLASVLPYAL